MAQMTSGDSEIRLVRGCPCFKTFGDETLCVNNDEILEVDVIEIDPAIFTFHKTREDIAREMVGDGVTCYAAIYVNYPDNSVYCISQGWKLRIHGRDVPGTDLEDALQFLSTKDLHATAEICSECLYKFLLTLADTFADTMSKEEKTQEIKKYVDKFSMMVAVKHSQVDSMMRPIGSEEDIDKTTDRFQFIREYLVQLLDQQQYWMELERQLTEEGADEWLIDLVRKRERLARFEFQFYSQTLQLRDINDFNLMIKMLSFILKTADEILKVNAEIHDAIRSKKFKQMVERDKRLSPLAEYAKKSRIVEHNFGNILQILTRI